MRVSHYSKMTTAYSDQTHRARCILSNTQSVFDYWFRCHDELTDYVHYVLLNSFGLFIIALKREGEEKVQSQRQTERTLQYVSFFQYHSQVCMHATPFHSNFNVWCLHLLRGVTEGGREKWCVLLLKLWCLERVDFQLPECLYTVVVVTNFIYLMTVPKLWAWVCAYRIHDSLYILVKIPCW